MMIPGTPGAPGDSVLPGALINASQNGRVEFVKLLIKHGADLNATCNDGRNSLLCASNEGHFEITQIFLVSLSPVALKNSTIITILTSSDQKKIFHGYCCTTHLSPWRGQFTF